MVKLINKKAHMRHLSSTRIVPVKEANYYKHEQGMSDSNTLEYTTFVSDIFKRLIGTESRMLLKLSRTDFLSINEKPVREVSIDELRRCDILVKTNINRNICIECQLSSISYNELEDRTLHYLNNNYEVLWIRKHKENKQRCYNILMKYLKSLNCTVDRYKYFDYELYLMR